MKHLALVLLILGLCSACSTYVRPSARPVDKFDIAEIKFSPVTVINAQSVSNDIKIGSSGTGMGQIPKTVYGNPREWTEIACQILKQELQKRTVTTEGQAPKVLRLSITTISLEPVVFLGGNKVKVHVTVETGAGISKEFDVEHTPASRRQIDENAGGALAKAVATILNDETIRKYLQK